MDLFNLRAVIGLDTSEYDRGIKNSSSLLSKTANGLKTTAKTIGKTVAVGIGAGATAFAALAKASLDAHGELEQNIGGSEAVFKEFADFIQEEGALAYKNLGLSQSDYLATANKMGALLKGSGFDIAESFELTTQTMQRAADVASIMGLDTSAAMEAIAGAAKGNFTMMDNLGVVVNDTAIAEYALSKGITKSTRDMSTQEKVGLAMELFMERTAYAAGNYARENETLAGSLGTAKAAFDNFLSGAGTAEQLIESVLSAAKVVTTNLITILPELAQGVGDLLAGLAPMLPDMIITLLPALASGAGTLIGSLVSQLPTIFKSLLSVLPDVGANLLAAIVTGVTGNETSAQDVKDFFANVFSEAKEFALEKWADIKEKFSEIWKNVKAPFEKAADWFGDTYREAKEKALDSWSNAKERFGTVWQNVKDAFGNSAVGSWFKEKFADAKEKALTAWDNAKTRFGTVWAEVKAAYNNGQLDEWFKTKFSDAKEKALTAWSNAKTRFGTVWSEVKNAYNRGQLDEWFKTKFSDAKDKALTAWDNAKERFGTVWDNVKAAFNESDIGKWFKESFSSAKEKALEAWSDIKEKLSSPFEDLKTNIGEIVDKILDFFDVEISWPHIPLPHFSISPKGWKLGDLLEGSVPSLSIAWYNRAMNNPMLLRGATIFGMQDGRLLGGGDAGGEVVAGANTVARLIYDAVRDAMGNMGGGIVVNQNIYSEAKTAADLMQEARWEAERAVLMGV